MRRLVWTGLLLLLVACGDDVPGPSDAGRSDGQANEDTGPLDTGPLDTGIAPVLSGISLVPASAELVALNGDQPSVDFEVHGTYSDGSTAPIQAGAFSVSPYALGTISGAGLFTADGRFGGTGTVRVEYSGLSAEASIRVRLESIVFDVGLSTATPPRFDIPPTVDPSREPVIVYPLDGAVMPQNVYPADIQWEQSTEGDLYRVRIDKPNAKLEAYLTASPGFRSAWLADQDGWRRIAQTDADDPAVITVERLDVASNQLLRSPSVNVRFARAALSGAIYYWDIVAGRIIRIDDGTAQRQAFLPNPPLDCVGCHSVSTSGRYMAGRFGGGDNIASVFDLTKDLTTNPPPLEFPTADALRWWFSSWSPDDTRLVVSVTEGGTGGRLAFVDPVAGSYVAPIEGALPDVPATHPAWAPDGTEIAFVTNNNDWGGANTTGDIYVLDLLGPDRVGGTRALVAGDQIPNALPAGSAASYPTYSPDSRLIAFAHGTSSRSETGLSALYLMNRDGSNVVRLNKASELQGDTSFQPRFSPFEQGGYFWLSFLSRRDYGNAQAGTKGSGRQQIWVSAVKTNPQPGEDPSEVGYWLPGQDTASLNISAFWAPRPCREGGSSCAVGAECCSEVCNVDAGGGGACTDPPSQSECAGFGRSCAITDDCCAPLDCLGGFCGGL